MFIYIVLAALIVSRLVYHRRDVRNALEAEHVSPYTNVITMCVESSVLMVIFNGLYTGPALAFTRRQPNMYGALIPFLVLPHI